MNTIVVKGGEYTVYYDVDMEITIQSDAPFNVYMSLGDEKFTPIGPASANSRYFKRKFEKDTELHITCDGIFSLNENIISPRREIPSGEKLVEIIPEDEMNMYDRLRAELLQVMSDMSSKKGDETFDESDDYELEEDDDTPLTPYEFADMKEEYLREVPKDEMTSEPEKDTPITDINPPPEDEAKTA